jgi:hypothetical protein
MLGNLQVFLGREVMNHYAETLTETSPCSGESASSSLFRFSCTPGPQSS